MNPPRRTRRVTANVPADLLRDACAASGSGITETIVEGLTMVKRRRVAEKAAKLKGRLRLKLNLGTSRERAGR